MSQRHNRSIRRPNAALRAALALAAWAKPQEVATLAARYRVTPADVKDSLRRLAEATSRWQAKDGGL